MVAAAYVESSALVKAFLNEPESDAFRAAVSAHRGASSSELAVVEVSRAVARVEDDEGLARARVTFLSFTLLPIERTILDRAARLSPSELRSLDAIHVATALEIGDPDLVFYSYDERTVAAARSAGLIVSSPGA